MKTEETIYQQNEGAEVANNENPQTENEIITTDVAVEGEEDQESEEGKSTWKKVAIGSVIGIALGSGAVYAADKTGVLEHIVGGNNEATDEVIDEVTDDTQSAEEVNYVGRSYTVDGELPIAETAKGLSFSEAFAAARSQVGAGGVFEWRGGIYGTYYANEWDNMSAEEKAEFGSHISYVSTPEPEGKIYVDKVEIEVTTGVDVVDVVDVYDDPDAEVQVLGMTEELLADGSVATVGHAENEVFLIDTDQDGIFEAVFVDSNQNGAISSDEYASIEDNCITTDSFEAVSDDQFLASTGAEYVNDDFNLA